MKIKKRYYLLPFIAIIFSYMLFVIYDEVRDKTIKEFNTQQTILAKQAAKGIESFFNYYLRSLTQFSTMDDVIYLNDNGKLLMETYYRTHLDVISAITRVDKSGRISYTVPFNKNAIGADISYQKHMRTIIENQQPVISDVFKAVQGYQAVAYHVPVFSNDIFQGTIAILIPFDNLAKEYLQNIKLGKSGYAWVISAGGIELYNPAQNQIGKTIINSPGLSVSMTKMINEMTKGISGTTIYAHNMSKGERVERIIKHAVYLPIRLGNTFWSIVVATPEEDVFSTMTGFRNKLLIIVALLMATGLFTSYYFIKALTILNEERKRRIVEKALLESENKFRSFAEHSLVGIYLIQDGIFRYVNPKFVEIFGYTIEKCMDNMHFSELIFPEDQFMVEEQMRKHISGEIKSAQYSFRGVRKNGEIIYVEVFGSTMRYNGKNAAIGTMLDITERMRSEEAQRTTHEGFLTVLNSIDATVYVSDMETHEILFMNKYMIESFGKDMTGEFCWDSFRGESEPCRHCTNDQLIDENGKPTGVCSWQDNNPITDKWYINNDRAIEWVDGRIVRIQIATDITELKMMEEELRQAHKMEAIGTLAGGIAHDFNNILGIIIGNTELAMGDVPEWNPAHSNLEEIRTAVLRAKDVVRQLLSFSRKSEQQSRLLNMVPIVNESIQLLRASIPSTIDIRSNIEENLSAIEADSTQIQQVIINLCTNAAHAMEQEGGTLSVNLSQINIDEKTSYKYNDVVPGRYILLSVSDTGEGIDPAVKDKIFDPYFTTKEVGKGSGMGLAIVHGIVTNNNGAISIKSEHGRGTTIKVIFPVSKEDYVEETSEFATLPTGDERILFVDDEESIVIMTEQILNRLGYNVESRMNPSEALEIFQTNPDEFDLIITDMTMPDMTGRDLAKELMSIRSDIPIILCTGYSDHIDAISAKEMGISAFVMKPIAMREIANTIRKVLDDK